jgi:protein TonB
MRIQCLAIVILFCQLSAVSLAATEFEVNPAWPEEIRNLQPDQIVKPASFALPFYPKKALKERVGAEVWVKFKISGRKPEKLEVVYCSRRGYDLERAAIQSVRESDFLYLVKNPSDYKDKWLYTKLTFVPRGEAGIIQIPEDLIYTLKLTDELINKIKKRFIEPVSTLMPEYPQAAYDSGKSAEVWTRFKLDKSNYVDSVEVLACSVDSLGFEEAAIKWMKSGEFHFPTKHNGKGGDWWYSRLNFMTEKWNWQLSRSGASAGTKGVPSDSTQDSTKSDSLVAETMPELVYKGRPRYPSKARVYGLTCLVYVKVLVSKEGKAESVLIHKTDDPDWRWGFNEAAITGAKQCRFKPATQDGKPVRVWVSFPFEFELHR